MKKMLAVALLTITQQSHADVVGALIKGISEGLNQPSPKSAATTPQVPSAQQAPINACADKGTVGQTLEFTLKPSPVPGSSNNSMYLSLVNTGNVSQVCRTGSNEQDCMKLNNAIALPSENLQGKPSFNLIVDGFPLKPVNSFLQSFTGQWPQALKSGIPSLPIRFSSTVKWAGERTRTGGNCTLVTDFVEFDPEAAAQINAKWAEKESASQSRQEKRTKDIGNLTAKYAATTKAPQDLLAAPIAVQVGGLLGGFRLVELIDVIQNHVRSKASYEISGKDFVIRQRVRDPVKQNTVDVGYLFKMMDTAPSNEGSNGKEALLMRLVMNGEEVPSSEIPRIFGEIVAGMKNQ